MPAGGTLTLRVGDMELDEAAAGEMDIPAGDYVRIEISDDGPGMEPEVAALAFQPFFTTKSVGMGAGLGLSTVYGFVRGSGGHVELQTVPGEGTSVTMYLPRYTEHGPLHAAFREPVVQDRA